MACADMHPAARASSLSPAWRVLRAGSLERYPTEGSPRLQHFTEITASLAKRDNAQELL